jgi:hypothetical protein
MNTSEIEVLLEKFYEGNSSLQEEKILRDFFRKQDVPAHLKPHQPLFAFYGAEQQRTISDPGFDQKLKFLILEESGEAPVVQMHPNRRRLVFATSIAASFLLVVGLFFTLRHDVNNRSLQQTDKQDAALAYANASEALMMVSGNLNNGLKQMEKLQVVEKAFKDFTLFHKFYQYQTLIINPDEISNQSIKSK